MFNKKQVYWLVSLALVLGFVFVQQQVSAQWTGPTTNPDGSANINVVQNPLDEDLDLDGYDLTNGGNLNLGGSISASSGSVSGNLQVDTLNGVDPADFLGGGGGIVTNPLTVDLNLGTHNVTNGGASFNRDINLNNKDVLNVRNLNVSTINGAAPGGGITNKMVDNLSGENRFYIYDLRGCDPAKDTSCAGLEAVAGKNAFDNGQTFSFGVWGQTDAASDKNPSYGVYGLATNSSGVGVTGYATKAGAFGIYGVAQDPLGVAAMFYNQAGGTALAVEGNIDFAGVKFLRTSGVGVFVPYTGTDGVRLEATNLTVDGIVSARSLQAIGDSEFSGNLTVVGQGYFDYHLTVDGGADVEGYLNTQPIFANVSARDDGHYPFGVSAIVGYATSTLAYEENAGVEGIGTVGVFGHGRLVGVYGSSGAYAGLFKGYTTETVRIDDPDPGLWGNSGNDFPDLEPFSSLLGINKTMADVSIPAAIGIVATGGWDRIGASFNSAGLGICALSGEKAYDAETLYNGEDSGGDFYEYCQDDSGKNNYAGFFAGDVYVKDGSMQLRDTLVAAGENLIYGNISNASAAGSHLIKLQTNGSDKFRVDRAGNAFLDGDLNMDDLTAGNITADDFVGDIATFDQVLLGENGILGFDTKGKNQPTCLAETEGYTYYFQDTKALCICTGSNWKAMINSQVDSACR